MMMIDDDDNDDDDDEMMAMTMAMPPMTDTNNDVNVKFSHHMTTYVNR